MIDLCRQLPYASSAQVKFFSHFWRPFQRNVSDGVYGGLGGLFAARFSNHVKTNDKAILRNGKKRHQALSWCNCFFNETTLSIHKSGAKRLNF